LTIATSNDQVLFTPGVVIGFSHTQGLDCQPSQKHFPTLRQGGAGMAVAYDEFNDSIAETHHTLRAGTRQSTGAIQNAVVRRLTPTECERLQGFPEGWTQDQADSHRYKQMGNAVTVNVIEWIGARL
jgi:site-specific DNA-cytosine methylase